MRLIKKVLAILGLSLLHLATVAFIFFLPVGPDRIKVGGELTTAERIQGALLNALVFPMYHLLEAMHIYGRWGDVLFVGNSLLWGAALFGLYAMARRIFRETSLGPDSN